jgi:phospholipid/cholesterol/gamma-HCH transport system permease protein
MIISLQVGIILRNNTGKAEEIGNLVANIMYRELGPMMTGLIVAASVGAAIAAEIATMQVSEEVDALQAMNINPARYLVMPRLMAMIIMLPVLTIYANLIGTLGGMLVADTQLGVSPHLYYNRAIVFLTNYHVYVGLLKSLVFAFIITAVSCHQGFAARNGAIGVGAATRTTVVHSFLLTLVIGYFITWLFY